MRGSKPGEHRGGRKKGTPNKTSLRSAWEILDAMGCDPIEGLARLAMSDTTPPAVRARCYSDLAQYLHPQIKPLEVQVQVPVGVADLTDEQLAAKIAELKARLG
jgi:hypothetical protein